MLRFILYSMIFLLLASSLPALAAEKAGQGAPVFFEALYDVPVMPGLNELQDQAMLFDKPNGRIAAVEAASKTLSALDIARFYQEVLPTLGWNKIKDNQYVRGGDQLLMEITAKPPLTFVRFTLSPIAKANE